MGFVGRFEMTVPDILQILSLSKKTGKLTLSRLGNSAEILFKNGMVISAISDSTRHTLSNILISQKRLSESALMAALELQHLSSDNKRLGAILIEKGIVTREVLQEALRAQIEQVMSEFLGWETGFFRFDMTEVVSDDGITIDVGAFLGKAGMKPELLFLDGTHRLDDRREAEMPRPERFDVAHRPERVEGLVEGPRPEQFGPESFDPELKTEGLTAEGHVEGLPAGLVDRRRENDRPPWIKPEASPAPDPTPTVRIEERRQVETPRPEHVEGRTEGPRPAPAVPRPERFDVTHRPEHVEGLVEGLAADTPTPSIPAGRKPPVPAPPVASQTSPAVSAGEALKPTTSTAKEQQGPTSAAPSGISLEGPFQEIEHSRITDEIMLNSPIAPWVLIMHLAADVVSRGVLLFVRKDGITGHDQFGVGGGRDSGDERIINIKIPWNEPSILAATTHARTTYWGKISPGKWNDYFLNQLGGKRPDEAVIIPIIVAGKVVAIFYGDDAGSGTPLRDVERLQALIGQTFSAVEASILEKRNKASA